jgi:SAM-dependent methyltransferase
MDCVRLPRDRDLQSQVIGDMDRILDELGYRLLKFIRRAPVDSEGGYEDSSHKLATHFGGDLWEAAQGKTVIDFGCGDGHEAIELGERGAKRVIGIEIRDRLLERANELARDRGVSGVCEFVKTTDAQAELVLSMDSFEHFDDPGAALESMSRMLCPGGEVWISFGWPWYHPYGGHFFSVFPWAHLVISEQSLIRWRSDFKSDGATRFGEVEGGLNQMSIRRLEQAVESSPLQMVELKLIPIRALRWLHGRPTREFTSAVVQCRLRAR